MNEEKKRPMPRKPVPSKNQTEKPQTTNSQLQTETMEVHHHPNVEKKGLKEYILEGLMIFLAVIMGFIAENIREGISENRRAAEFAHSYYEDIKNDTAQLHKLIKFSKHKIAACDSTIASFHLPDSRHNDTIIYSEGQVVTNVYPFHSSSGSYEQIKSSGSLRFFKQKIINLMNEYDLQTKSITAREDIDMKFIIEQAIPFFGTVYNTEVSYDFRFGSTTTHELYVSDRSLITKRLLINKIIAAKLFRMRAMQEYVKLLKISDSVLTELKTEYNLKDE